MTLDEFLARAPATLQSFAEATRRMHDERTDPKDMSMSPYHHRDEWWWFRDVGAYLQCLDLDESLKQRGAPGLEGCK